MRIRFLQDLRYKLMEREGKKHRTERKVVGKGAAVFPVEPAPAWNLLDQKDKFLGLKTRWELTKLVRPQGIAAEFGVANGVFSDLILKEPNFNYIDGFAATGQDADSALHDWRPKINDSGVFAGHDYADKWPQTKKANDDFARDKKLAMHTVGGTPDPEYESNRFASWFLVRE